MSIIKFAAPIAGARGTIGGLIFSANKSGPYVKAWAKGSDPLSPKQSVQRGQLAQMPALWAALSDAQRLAWDVFAALPAQDLTNSLGETYSISGFGWFCKINIRLIVIGRAARQAVPVQARPAAPTITDLEFPLDSGQTAFVEYASAEFDPDFDLVLDAALASSVGRQTPPTSFTEVALQQDPDDTETGFAFNFADIWGLANTGLKGFLRLYRQTTDGLRSSAGTADFVASDGTNYTPAAKDYDAVTNYAGRAGGITGASNGKICTIVGWFRVDGGDSTNRAIFNNTSSRFLLRLTAADRLQFLGVNDAAATVVNIASDATFSSGAAWHAFALSIDTSIPLVRLVIDNSIDDFSIATLTPDGIMDFDQAAYSFGARPGGSQLWDGCLSSFWLSLDEAMDVHDPRVLSIFFSRDNGPQFLGSTGQLPNAITPVIYFPDGDAEDNVGVGENFINVGVLNACGTTP